MFAKRMQNVVTPLRRGYTKRYEHTLVYLSNRKLTNGLKMIANTGRYQNSYL